MSLHPKQSTLLYKTGCKIFQSVVSLQNQNRINQSKFQNINVMKPLLILFTLVTFLFSQPLLANERDVTPSVLKSFQTTFSDAKDVEWIVGETLYKARFELNGQVVMAYYNTQGSLLAITRNITSHQLPLALQTALKKGHESLWITELFEMSNDQGTVYYATLENAENKVVLKSSATSGWNVYSKDKKD